MAFVYNKEKLESTDTERNITLKHLIPFHADWPNAPASSGTVFWLFIADKIFDFTAYYRRDYLPNQKQNITWFPKGSPLNPSYCIISSNNPKDQLNEEEEEELFPIISEALCAFAAGAMLEKVGYIACEFGEHSRKVTYNNFDNV